MSPARRRTEHPTNPFRLSERVRQKWLSARLARDVHQLTRAKKQSELAKERTITSLEQSSHVPRLTK